MIDIADIRTPSGPAADPTDSDLAAWQALTRDDQLRRLRARLEHPDCSTVSPATMSDILSRAKAGAKRRHD